MVLPPSAERTEVGLIGIAINEGKKDRTGLAVKPVPANSGESDHCL